MNKLCVLLLLCSIMFSGVEFFWDLGVGISDIPVKQKNSDISISTFHRLEGLKKYYSMDYESAIYHFSQLNIASQSSILYEYVDCYYTMNKFSTAIQVLESYSNSELSENMIYLKSKIYCKLNLYDSALEDLNYLIQFYPNSDYVNILQFEIEKINLLK
jgi:tetratricopeptide (TPR) repeat protein